MLRSFFISLSKAGWAQRWITSWGFARRASARFVAGETIPQALDAVRAMNALGINASLDHLGENTSSPQEAREAAGEVVILLDAIRQSGVRANVSIKLSQIGLALSEELCRENLARILTCARDCGNFIRIDMEDSSLTGRTLAAYFWAREQGFENVGIVLQAYLLRTREDLAQVTNAGGRVRLCKGAYQEPATLAFAVKADTDANYDHLMETLLQAAQTAGLPRASGLTPPIPALATHDERRIAAARAAVERLGLPKDALEFQMLYGIRRDLQVALARDGFPVRVYIPYGTHWYPYFMRRLAERPANLWFFISNFFRR